jgi:DNA polymerase-3 subunit delta'
MLKTLEEPRPGVHIVLCTAARDRLLPTILSRTQRIRFGALPPVALQAIGQAHGIPAARANTAAALAGGSATRLLALASAEGDVGPFAEAAELRRAAAGRQVADLFDAAMRFGDKESKQQLPEILSLMAGLYRDALVSAAGAGELVQLGEHRAEIDAMVPAGGADAGLALGSLSRSLRAVLDAQEACLGNVNAVALLERLLFQLAHHTEGQRGPEQSAHS